MPAGSFVKNLRRFLKRVVTILRLVRSKWKYEESCGMGELPPAFHQTRRFSA
jgi:hypothetical protein